VVIIAYMQSKKYTNRNVTKSRFLIVNQALLTLEAYFTKKGSAFLLLVLGF